ncbi:hypothetical protein BAE44_0016837 [Dichanthelium oligosanthes]|uniref:Acetyltransferase n=1 Tax=Dichanthelium oligosanthes TaxID=888268 RepID=A0A1E5VAG0_9POAL|nr:hypothetical protein BAE44_0016837 [Dichanthelium oligosanthes]
MEMEGGGVRAVSPRMERGMRRLTPRPPAATANRNGIHLTPKEEADVIQLTPKKEAEVLGADAAIKALPLVSVQITELADGVFVGMTSNHSVGDGTAFWHFLNTWSEIHRRGVDISDDDLRGLSTPPPVPRRWFAETCPVPDFTYMGNLSSASTALVTGSSSRFDVFGNDFGWGKPVAIRSGVGNKADGKATVFEGPERGREHVAGGVHRAGRAREARRRRGVHGRGEQIIPG